MNITGNHDIGYAGELDGNRLGRWEHHFGPSNYVHTLEIPDLPPFRIILFNSLNLDSPAGESELQQVTHSFLTSLLQEEDEPAPQSVLLTHLPLYRGPGVCSDPPRFNYWSLTITDRNGNVTGYFRPIKSQNHLSRWASDWILETIFGEEDRGVILGGHDHVGCDVLHRRLSESEQEQGRLENEVAHTNEHDELKRRHRKRDAEEIEESVEAAIEENFEVEHPEPEDDHDPHSTELMQQEAHMRNNLSHGIWRAEKFTPHVSGIREITVRSMMGDFAGNVGLLTGTYNLDSQCITLPLVFGC
jgi:hypothetical protein